MRIVKFRSVLVTAAAFVLGSCTQAASDSGSTAASAPTATTALATTTHPVETLAPKVYGPSIHGPIPDKRISSSIAAELSGSNRSDVIDAMRSEPIAKRQYIRWATLPGGFVVWLQDPSIKAVFPTKPAGLGYRVLNWKGNWYYYPMTGKLEQTPQA